MKKIDSNLVTFIPRFVFEKSGNKHEVNIYKEDWLKDDHWLSLIKRIRLINNKFVLVYWIDKDPICTLYKL